MNTQTFQPIAPRPAPVNTEGPVAWVKANLFGDWKTSLATLVIGAAAALAGAATSEMGHCQGGLGGRL